MKTERNEIDKVEKGKILLSAKEDERRRIARELHDGPAQTLAAVILRLDLLVAGSPDSPGQIMPELELLRNISRDCLQEIRQILYELKPVCAEDCLSSALRGLCADSRSLYDFRVEFENRGTPRTYPVHIQTAVFRLVQEAVNNSRKHAGVDKAAVILTEDGGKIEVFIADQGRGFDLEKVLAQKDCLGITGMRERAALLGGTLQIKSESGAGTKILLGIPLKGDLL